MNKIEKIYTMEKDVEKEMILMVTGLIDKGLSKSGDPFVSVEMFDGIKKIKVNFFNDTVESLSKREVIKGSILKVKLTHGSNGYYNQSGWDVISDGSISEKDFAYVAPIDPEECFEWLVGKIKAVDPNPEEVGPYKSLSSLTVKLLEKNADAFKRSSAAVTMHHNFMSGLIYHTVRMVSMAIKTCEVYRALDKELLVCGTALHDIGKISCYETTDYGDASVTLEGRLLDHALVGIMMIHDEAKEGSYDQEKLILLEHLLASHHGKKEWDAITTPAFPEAMMLHVIDLADSRMNMFEEAYKEQKAGTISDDKIYGLENSHIYKPLIYEENSINI